jgi:hypothetical protein
MKIIFSPQAIFRLRVYSLTLGGIFTSFLIGVSLVFYSYTAVVITAATCLMFGWALIIYLVCDITDRRIEHQTGYMQETWRPSIYKFTTRDGHVSKIYVNNTEGQYTKRIEVTPETLVRIKYTRRFHLLLEYTCVDYDEDQMEYEWCYTKRDLLHSGLRWCGYGFTVIVLFAVFSWRYYTLFTPLLSINFVSLFVGGILFSRGWRYIMDYLRGDFEYLEGIPEFTEKPGRYHMDGFYFNFERRRGTGDLIRAQLRVNPQFSTSAIVAVRSNTLIRYRRVMSRR